MNKASVSTQPVGERSDSYKERRLEILRAAALAFAEDGYHQTSVNSLAERLGVSKPVLYYYAKNKDDLLYQVGEVAREKLARAIKDATDTRVSGADKVRRFFVTYADIMCGDFGRCLALVDPRALSPEARAKDVAYRRKLEQDVGRLIREGQVDGTIRDVDPVLALRALFGAFNGIPRWFNDNGAMKASDVVDAYMDLFMIGLSER